MKKYQILLVYLTLIPGITSYSQQVSLETAQKVASHFITFNMPPDGAAKQESFQLTDCYTKSQDEQEVYFVFKLSPKGFIIISGDYRAVPILAYSFHNNYYPHNLSPALQAWMEAYSNQLTSVISEDNPDQAEANELWTYYLNGSFSERSMTSKDSGVDPMIRSIWEQGKKYNDSCPEHPDGPGGHCYAGCVAISLAQIMFYYRFPDIGVGSNTYTIFYSDTVSVDFSKSSFRWTEMVNYIFGLRNPAVADLIFKAGASINTDYTPYGSGSYPFLCPDALINYFKYDSSAVHYYRSDTLIDWKDTLLNNLDNLQPVLYSGGSWPVRHSFVCDGYEDTSYFHFNFGWWDGSGNGFYYLDDITPFHYDFTAMQNAVFNIYPSGNYPPYASGFDTLTTPRGTFEDGSGPLAYLENTDAYWLIAPEEEAQIMLYFDRFETHPGDIVTVYDGDNPNADILGIFSGDNIPYTINSTSNRMLIHFLSDDVENAQGWYAHYITLDQAFCQSLSEYTDTAGYIHDGSGIYYDYMNLTDCYWLINPQGNFYDSVSGITLKLIDFASEEDIDILTVFDGPTTNSPVLDQVSGNDYPEKISSTSNQMLLQFQSNENTTNTGFIARYSIRLPIYCDDTSIMSTNTGILTDGSGVKKYSNNSDCYWLIQPENYSDTIFLNFTEFDLEYGYDWIEIIDPNAYPPNILGHYTGDQAPSEIRADHGAMLIHFYSDLSIAKTGWEAEYSIGSHGIPEKVFLEDLTVWPNPASESFIIDINSLRQLRVYYELIDLTGSVLAEGNDQLGKGFNSIEVNCRAIPAGLYVLKVRCEGAVLFKKVIIQ